MADYLDGYGVVDARRERRRRRIILCSFVAALVGVTGYLYVRTWREERVVKQFFATLERRDFQGAYKMFGCTQDTPCPNYDPARFTEDWGADSPYSKGSAARVANVDFCDNGVVFLVNYPNAEPVSLWVERSTKVISFAPWPRCPGRHWELGRFFRSLFS